MHTTNEIAPTLEEERIKVLRGYGILDTPPDATFDILTKLAARLLNVPIAIVSIVDKERIWFKSRFGVEIMEIGKEPGLCSTAILGDELYEIQDTLTDSRSMEHPLVVGDFGLRFYAAVPLRIKDGYNLGTLCIMDKEPKTLSETDKEILRSLADLVMDHLDLKLEVKMAIKRQNHILNTTAHDLKNPLSIMPLLADMIIHNKSNPKAIDDIALQIKEAGRRMSRVIDDLLESALEESGRVKLRLKALKLASVVGAVIRTNSALAKNKKQVLHLEIEKDCKIYADRDRLTEIIDNLVNNAIKYSPLGKPIYVRIWENEKHAVVEVKDEGPGLTKDDMRNLFRRFTSLSALPTGGENSTGLGLSIVKNLVEAHRGHIWAECEGPGKGTKFVVELPLSECH